MENRERGKRRKTVFGPIKVACIYYEGTNFSRLLKAAILGERTFISFQGLTMRELNWKHHTLIQALLARGPLREDRFRSLFTRITEKNPDNDQQLFNSYLLAINKALSFAQFELRGCRNQYDGRVYYGLVNNVSDEQSKLGTKYSVPQIAYFKAIVEAIAQDPSAQGGISNIAALHLQLENQVGDTESQSQVIPPAFKNFTISLKEKTIAELAQDQWLDCTPEGFVNLGVRSFLDLRSWFRTNDVPSCEVCNEAGVKAELCSNEACAVRVHRYCLKKMLSSKKSKRACPGCGTQWQSTAPNGESREEEEEDEPETLTQGPSSSRKRKKSRSRLNIDIDSGPNAHSMDAAQPSQPPPDTKKRVTQPSQPPPDTKRVTRSSRQRR